MKYIRVEGDVAFVELTQGQETKIDRADIPLIAGKSWYAVKTSIGFYAFAKGKAVHRLITGCPKGLEVDHLNHDTLDNRRINLRCGTHKENMANGRFALVTHCPKGHPYDEANTYINKKGKRICRKCNAERVAAIYKAEPSDQREKRRLRMKSNHEKNREARLVAMVEYGRQYRQRRKGLSV
jgi:hypothetical protein